MFRSALFYTLDNVPHPDFSFPFTPNKAADNANRGMVWKEADSGNVAPSSLLIDWPGVKRTSHFT